MHGHWEKKRTRTFFQACPEVKLAHWAKLNVTLTLEKWEILVPQYKEMKAFKRNILVVA